MRDLTETSISRRLGEILDEAKKASTARFLQNYRDVAFLMAHFTHEPQRYGTSLTGWMNDTCPHATLTLIWEDRTMSPILRLRKFGMDTENGVEDIERRANPNTFKELFNLGRKCEEETQE